MLIQTNKDVVLITRESQYVLPTSEPLLTVLGSSKKSLKSLGFSEDEIEQANTSDGTTPLYRFLVRTYPEMIIRVIGSWDAARSVDITEELLSRSTNLFRWTAWLNPDPETDIWEYEEDFCLMGYCSREELAAISNQYLQSAERFLAFPVYKTSEVSPRGQALLVDWEY